MPYGTVNTDKLEGTLGGIISPDSSVFRNRIINGAMVIDQRNAGASVTNIAGGVYTIDRWIAYGSQASKFTIQQNAGSVTPPSRFTNYVGITSSSAYTVGSSEEFEIYQWIEGFNFADLGFGTANAKTVTLSFWVRSSLTGTFGGSLQNSASNRSYVFSYTILAANTWEQKTITIAGDTTGTWLTTNGRGIGVLFGLGQGSSMSTTAGSWVSGNYNNVTGGTSVVGTNGATYQITGVQLEAGFTASSFEYRPFGTELNLCQRYFCKTYNYGTVPGTVTSVGNLFNSMDATQSYGYTGQFNYPVTMRVTPTVVSYSPNTGTAGQIAADAANYAASTTTAGDSRVAIGVSDVSIGTSTYLRAHATASAEL